MAGKKKAASPQPEKPVQTRDVTITVRAKGRTEDELLENALSQIRLACETMTAFAFAVDFEDLDEDSELDDEDPEGP